jgi:hypothetical protein
MWPKKTILWSKRRIIVLRIIVMWYRVCHRRTVGLVISYAFPIINKQLRLIEVKINKDIVMLFLTTKDDFNRNLMNSDPWWRAAAHVWDFSPIGLFERFVFHVCVHSSKGDSIGETLQLAQLTSSAVRTSLLASWLCTKETTSGFGNSQTLTCWLEAKISAPSTMQWKLRTKKDKIFNSYR